MFKKIILMMIISQMLIGEAFAGNENLKTAFDELAYVLTVEWDQKDPVIARNAVKDFQDKLSEARADGLTNAESEAFYKSLLNNSVDVEIEKFSQDMRAGKFSHDEAKRELTAIVNKAYAQRASWHPALYVLIGATSVVVLFGLFVLGLHIKDKWGYEEDSGNDFPPPDLKP